MWTVTPARLVHLIIDMQKDFVEPGRPMEVPMARDRLPQMLQLLQHSRHQEIPIIYTQHVLFDTFDVSPLETAIQPKLKQTGLRNGTDGIKVVDHLAPRTDDITVVKHRYDAFHNTELESLLNTMRGLRTVDTVLITGTVTEACCESTARSAFMRDYKVIFASEATGGLTPEGQIATERTISNFFGRVMTNAEIAALFQKDSLNAP